MITHAIGTFYITYFDANSTHRLSALCMLATTVMGGAFLQISLIFPREFTILRRFPSIKWLPLLISVIIGLICCYFYLKTPGFAAITVERYELAYSITRASTVWLFFGIVTLFLLLPFHYLASGKGTIERQQAGICILGAAVGFFPVGVLYGVPFILQVEPIIALNTALPFIILFPVAIAYAIVQLNFLDIEIVIKRGLLYSIITLILGGLYVAVGTILEYGFFLGSGLRNTEAGLVSTAIVVALFVPLHEGLSRGIDRRFFRQAYEAQRIVEEVSHTLVSELDPARIATRILRGVQEALHVASGAVYIHDPQGDVYRAAAWLTGPPPPDIPAADQFVDALGREKVYRRQVRPGSTGERSDAPGDLQADVAVAMGSKDQIVGFLALGPRRPAKPFNELDLRLLSTLANQGAIAVRNAQRFRQLASARDSLARAERLAFLGTLSAEVAHELSTPLSVVRGQLELHGKSLEPQVKDRLQRQLEKMDTVVRDLLQFGKTVASDFRDVDLADVLSSAVETLALTTRGSDSVALKLDLPRNLPPVRCDPHRLEQVFINLFRNSLQAMEAVEMPALLVSAELAGDHIEIRVADNGCGIPQESLSRLFEPFHSTKREQGGTGLGLTVSRGLLAELGSTIEAQSEPGAGTTMIVKLPAVIPKPGEGGGVEDQAAHR